MYVCWLILLVNVLSFPSLTKSEIKPVLINQFDLPHAGFSTLLRSQTSNSTSWTFVISCFNAIPETTDYVYSVPNVEKQLTTKITPVSLTNQITWPNGIVPADPLVTNSIIVPSGFLVPGKTKGNLYYLDTNGPIALVPNEITHWFYHDATFKDINMDGYIDIVAGRANVPILGKPQSQLIWLKNPGKTDITGPWELHFLMQQNGPDIDVQFAKVDGTEVLFGNSYFTHKLQMFWSLTNPFWNDTSGFRARDIDSDSLSYAYIELTMDLNGDQRPDLLVTFNDEFNGSLIAYELPPSGQLFNGTFQKHVLASGFKPATSGKGRGAPGQGIPLQFYPLTTRKKPIIILSGDDDGSVYLLEAVHDNNVSDWQYNVKTIHESTKSTIGQISIEDVDNDGHPEMFVPSYNDGKVFIYRLVDDTSK